MAVLESRADVLIVDDENNVQAFFEAWLGRSGYRCDIAGDGREAFRKASRGRYRLVIMDIHMPDWDGMEAIVSMGLVHPDQKVLVISGHLDPEVIAGLRSAPNVIGWLEKPVNLGEFDELVERALASTTGAAAR